MLHEALVLAEGRHKFLQEVVWALRPVPHRDGAIEEVIDLLDQNKVPLGMVGDCGGDSSPVRCSGLG